MPVRSESHSKSRRRGAQTMEFHPETQTNKTRPPTETKRHTLPSGRRRAFRSFTSASLLVFRDRDLTTLSAPPFFLDLPPPPPPFPPFICVSCAGVEAVCKKRICTRPSPSARAEGAEGQRVEERMNLQHSCRAVEKRTPPASKTHGGPCRGCAKSVQRRSAFFCLFVLRFFPARTHPRIPSPPAPGANSRAAARIRLR